MKKVMMLMSNKTTKLFEVDLYKPIQEHFIEQGYEVYGEVNHCDIAAIKDDELVIVELKLNISIKLLIQATKRQRLSDQVYIAIPRPTYSLRSKKWQDICYLVRRLELGLMIVTFKNGTALVEIILAPADFDRKKSMQSSKKKRDLLLTEMQGRHRDHNVGGSKNQKIMTAYKENCIHIACCLERLGQLSTSDLRQMGTGDKTVSILNKNYYGWFERVRRGTYSLSDKGKNELTSYPQLVHYYGELIANKLG
ncbi:DUF2161 domain-containing phosphodiesterase [Cytobacillus sp. IB215665]|uniref:DUF2161 domain-containing phosphodiesterase n=1 Tax=Cytobacillus sp. IB215665 TaxID=3097357 RepID=UPI002A0FE7A4|nr:DUF2161 family putative PD-(D/E)XK-type phosphodiesterase [Cytobacillus sp. IB215665]MDX8367917.1 DUF2161 family putative PD-(D/E)XK-type phosphodiesterase [Cytobacillus sp. IB215665]